MQGILDMLAIPYTGSGITASAIAMDKPQCKRIWQALDLPTPDFQLITPTTNPQTVIQQLGLPLCIKPVQTGSSLGVQRVSPINQFLPAYHQAQQHAPHVIAEPWIDGEEYTVGILGDQVLPSIRIQADRGADGDSFYDFHAKYQAGTTEYHCPSGLSADEEAALQGLCLRAYQAIDCRHWGRVDLMRDRAGQFWLLEVNTVPGMTETSLVPKAAKAVGVSFEELVVQLLGMITN
jgi:D-alanine-D-alanine ligase